MAMDPTTAMNKGKEMLQFGYNIFGRYCSVLSSMATHPLFRIDEKNSQLLYSREGTLDYFACAEQTTESFSKKLSISSGLDGKYGSFFKGSIEAHYQNTYSEHQSYFYARADWNVSAGIVHLKTKEITQKAQTDIDTLPPIELFRIYGTHYVQNVIVGAKSTYYQYGLQSDWTNETDISASLKIDMGIIQSRSSVDTNTKISGSKFQGATSLAVKGGSAETQGLISCANDYASWVATIDKNPECILFTKDSLVGIWNLATTPSRKVQLQQAFDIYANAMYSGFLYGGYVSHYDFTSKTFYENNQAWVAPTSSTPPDPNALASIRDKLKIMPFYGKSWCPPDHHSCAYVYWLLTELDMNQNPFEGALVVGGKMVGFSEDDWGSQDSNTTPISIFGGNGPNGAPENIIINLNTITLEQARNTKQQAYIVVGGFCESPGGEFGFWGTRTTVAQKIGRVSGYNATAGWINEATLVYLYLKDVSILF